MGRKLARETALKALYQMDIAHTTSQEAIYNVLEQQRLEPRDEEFLNDLVAGYWRNQKEIDEHIARFAKEWSVERLSNVDRAILRMAVYEILKRPDIPIGVSINEAVDLAKKYSGAESGPFINGVLGGLQRSLAVTGLEG